MNDVKTCEKAYLYIMHFVFILPKSLSLLTCCEKFGDFHFLSSHILDWVQVLTGIFFAFS